MPKRVGRPAVKRAADVRVPLATRVRGTIYNGLIDAAAANDRPLGTEVERLIEQSLFVARMGSGGGLRVMMQVFMEFDRAGSQFADKLGIERDDWAVSSAAVYQMAIEAAVARLCYLAPGPWNGLAMRGMVEQGCIRAERERLRDEGYEPVTKDGLTSWRIKE